jgi:biotin carboxyl carrier protein
MKSPKAGRVVQVTAREGATVAAGDVLATIE